MKRLRMLCIVLVLTGVIGLAVYPFVRPHAAPSTPSPPVSADPFPIVPRVHLMRNYGYFIGDPIPLTLEIEATGDVVLDLVNLPQKGEQHGRFEIRDVRLTSTSASKQRTIYQADYILQYFGVTPLTVQFEPLEILYALPEQRAATTSVYTYKSLFTQPVAINLARIGPYRSAPTFAPKGPVSDERTWLIRAGFAFGALLLVTALSGWYREWQRRQGRRRQTADAAPTLAEVTLHQLRQESETFRSTEAPASPSGSQLSHIIRHYLQAQYALPALTLTTAELTEPLHDMPDGPELLDILKRCDDLTYQAPTSSSAEEQQLWWEAMTLFEKLPQGASP